MPKPDIAIPERTKYIEIRTSFAAKYCIVGAFEGSADLYTLFMYIKRNNMNIKKIKAKKISDLRSPKSFNCSLFSICLNTPYPNKRTKNQCKDFAKKLCFNFSCAN